MSLLTIVIILIWLVSVASLAILAYKKWPHLKAAPAPDVGKIVPGSEFFRRARLSFRDIFPDKILHKAILRLHILTLKSSNKTGGWLERLRDQSRSRRDKETRKDEDRYWEELKKTAKK